MTGAKETATEDVTADVVCTFCLKPTSDVASMVAGPGVFICNECVALCVELIETKPAGMPKLASWKERVSDQELLTTVPKIAAAGTQVDRQLAEWVTQGRARGITWTRIGAALGMTRQSAWERFSGEE